MMLNSSTLAPQKQLRQEQGKERAYAQPTLYVYEPFGSSSAGMLH